MKSNLRTADPDRSFPFSLAISDPTLDDNPLVYVSDAFERLTGYSREVVVGRNCRFLQGEDTDPEAVKKIGEAIRNRQEL